MTGPSASTEVAGQGGLSLRQLAAALPRAAVLYLARLALAEGHTPDGATGLVVEHLVATGELADSPQLRALVAAWVGVIAAARRPPVRRGGRTTVAATVVEHEAAELPAEAIEALPAPSEER